jgi:MFS family permease
VGVVALALIFFAVSAVTQVWQLLALYALALPVAVSLTTAVVCNPLVSRWFVRRLGLALGVSAFGIGIAGIVLPPLIAEALPAIGWRNIWRLAALLVALVVLPLVLLIVRERPTEREGLHYLGQTASTEAGPRLTWKSIVWRKNFLLVAATFMALLCVFIGAMQNIVPIALSYGQPQRAAGLLLSVLSGSYVVSTLVMGAMSDKFGNRTPLLLLSAAGVGGMLLLGIGGGSSMLFLGAALAGACGGMYPVAAAAMGAEFGAAGMGQAYGILTMLTALPALASPLIARSQEITGSYRPALWTIAALTALAGAAVTQLRERRAS